MFDMLVLVTGKLHELVWSSRVKFCISHFAMVENDSSFTKWDFHINDELIKILLDNKNELGPVKFLILSIAR